MGLVMWWVKEDGTVVAIGENTDSVTLRIGEYYKRRRGDYHTVGLRADGTVIAVGEIQHQCDVEDWTDVIAISAGEDIRLG